MKKIIIAIDGPAASGKSTTAKLVADQLGYLHIDTGAMYRAMALKVLRSKISPTDSASIARLASSTSVRLVHNSENKQKLRVELDGHEVSDEIRLPEVTNIVSPVSTVQEVRALMVKEQRAMGKEGGIVLEGRDIGTVVFPNAELKIFMKADSHERALRRKKELDAKGVAVSLDQLEQEIADRDAIDSQREISPLRKADDAVEVDTTNLAIDQQV
ncbi:MAG: (d)CMP kinase, partial [Ignavibacteriales bacterium]|nr:(d)CMP kinase [Ignavibacteriales bacterium]